MSRSPNTPSSPTAERAIPPATAQARPQPTIRGVALLRHAAAVAILLVPCAASARDPATRSVMVFAGATDHGAQGSTLKMASLVEDTLGRADHYQLTTLRDAAGQRVPADARAALHGAEDDLAAGKKAFNEGNLEAAEASLKSAVKEFEAGVTGIDHPNGYADALAYLAAVRQLKHQDDDARDTLTALLAVEPAYQLDAKLGAGPLRTLLTQAHHGQGSAHTGSLSIFSTPTGSQFFIDGVARGYTPASIDRLPVGKHLVRFERPGFVNGGKVVDVISTDDTAVKVSLSPTKDYGDMQDSVAQALKEVSASSCGPATFRLLKHYNLDRAVFANVRTTGDSVVLDLALVDLTLHHRIARRHNSLEGDDVSRQVDRLVKDLLKDAEDRDRPKAKATSSDPLDSVSGMEDWDDDDGSSRTHAKKHDE